MFTDSEVLHHKTFGYIVMGDNTRFFAVLNEDLVWER